LKIVISENVGENIRRIRKLRGLTQKELGEMLGATEAFVRAYECGRRNPKDVTLKKIARVLDVDYTILKGYKTERINEIELESDMGYLLKDNTLAIIIQR